MEERPTNRFPLKRCPVCRARMQGDEGLDEPCRRCGSDLRWVRACGYHATYWHQRAQAHLEEDAPLQALSAARRALTFVDAPELREALQAAQHIYQEQQAAETTT